MAPSTITKLQTITLSADLRDTPTKIDGAVAALSFTEPLHLPANRLGAALTQNEAALAQSVSFRNTGARALADLQAFATTTTDTELEQRLGAALTDAGFATLVATPLVDVVVSSVTVGIEGTPPPVTISIPPSRTNSTCAPRPRQSP